MRISLEEERRTATLKRVGLELDLGRHAELTGELQRLTAQYPLDEVCVGYQMMALYRSGRQADALRLYQEARERLVEQGVEPGPGLSALQQRILRHDPELARTPARRRQALLPRSHGMPPSSAGFVGREEEVQALTREEQPSSRQVKIIEGMPGVGKTALAVHVARKLAERYPDGHLYLKFHTHEAGQVPLDAAEALRSLLAMVGVPVTPMPRSLHELTALWQHELQHRRWVIILDDVPDLDAIAPVLPETGSCLTLVTTRRRMADLPGSSVLSLDVLPPPDAIKLFTQIIGLEKADDPAAVAKAVRLCGYLPLAIGLTASRLRDGGLTTVSEFVGDVMELSAIPDGIGAANRQLMSAFELSYQSLGGDQQKVFRHLGMSPCPDFTVYTAAAVAGIPVSEAENALAALLDRHLVERAAPRRFRFHDLIRAFAAFIVQRDGTDRERRHAERGLLDYYLYVLDRADRSLYPYRKRKAVQAARRVAVPPIMDSSGKAQEWLESEWRNILRLAEYAIMHDWQRRGADLAHVLAEFMQARGCWGEAIGLHASTVQACRDIDDSARFARAALDLSLVARHTGQHDVALQHAEQALATYRSLADHSGEAAVLDRIGTIYDHFGRSREALAYYREARRIYHEIGNRSGQAETNAHMGISHMYLSRFPQAAEHLRNSLRLFRSIGSERGEAKVLLNLGVVQERLGHRSRALQSYGRALDIYSKMGFRQSQAILNQNIGNIYQYRGRYEAALTAYRTALMTYRSTGDLRQQAAAFHDIGETYYCMGRHDESLVHYEKAKSIAEHIGDYRVMLVTLHGIADTECALGRYDAARQNYDNALRLARELGDLHEEGKILAGIAESLFRTKGSYAARIYWQQALEILRDLGVPETKSVQRRLDALGESASLDAGHTDHDLLHVACRAQPPCGIECRNLRLP
jgi:tetratricopeptide (TPR) repeat protein